MNGSSPASRVATGTCGIARGTTPRTASAIARIACPIGAPDVTGKHPAVIAVSVAADLARTLRKAAP